MRAPQTPCVVAFIGSEETIAVPVFKDDMLHPHATYIFFQLYILPFHKYGCQTFDWKLKEVL